MDADLLMQASWCISFSQKKITLKTITQGVSLQMKLECPCVNIPMGRSDNVFEHMMVKGYVHTHWQGYYNLYPKKD